MKKILIIIILFISPLIVANIFKADDSLFEEEPELIETENIDEEEPTIRVMFEDSTIEEVELDKYLIGVLAGEMPSSFPLEALKAQAVASRSYVLYQKNNNNNRDYDVMNTTTNQVYKNEETLRAAWKDEYDTKIEKINQAVSETHNEVMTYNDQIINALFFSTAPGYTENSEDVFTSNLPYLRSVESNWDTKAPNYKSTQTFTLDEFKQKLGLITASTILVGEKSKTGRIKTLIIDNITIKSNIIRNKLGLRSTYFDYDIKDNKITFTTYGYGHGVGMSQYGAKYMAEDGYNYKEILNHYYTGIKIVKNV